MISDGSADDVLFSKNLIVKYNLLHFNREEHEEKHSEIFWEITAYLYYTTVL